MNLRSFEKLAFILIIMATALSSGCQQKYIATNNQTYPDPLLVSEKSANSPQNFSKSTTNSQP